MVVLLHPDRSDTMDMPQTHLQATAVLLRDPVARLQATMLLDRATVVLPRHSATTEVSLLGDRLDAGC